MIRRIIQIDEEKCNGCGVCAAACHEGAIGMVDGKAKLLRDDYCDGLGDCLPQCPTVCRSVRQEQSVLWSGRLPHTMSRQCWKTREKKQSSQRQNFPAVRDSE